MDWMAEACPRDAPELPSTADDRQQQYPLNLKQMLALNQQAPHGNTLVMRRSERRQGCSSAPCSAYRLSQVTGPRLEGATGGGIGLRPPAVTSKVSALTTSDW